jgi:uncharacterized protein YjbI with pentapeptide repeats
MPASEQVRSRIAAGEPVSFSQRTPDDQRTIPAEWIEEAVLKSGGVKIANAIVHGPLRLKYARFQKEFSLLRCELTDPVDLSCATFEQNLILSGSVFRHGADLRSSSLLCTARLVACKFLSGAARFADLHVHGQFAAQAVRFCQGVKPKFERARFDSYAIFRGATFQGEAIFDDAVFASDADFDGASFEKLARFDETKIRGPAHFAKAVFGGEGVFGGSVIDSDADFCLAAFRDAVSFDRVIIKGTAHFDHAAFEGKADFTGLVIDGDGDFRDAEFRSKEAKAVFESSRFGGDAVFIRAAFANEASFLCAHIVGQAEFQGAVFEACANCNSAVIDRDAFFRPEEATDDDPKPAPHVTFGGEADFTGVSIGGDADFREAVFNDAASFNAVSIGGRAVFKDARFTPRSKPRTDPMREDFVDFTDAKFEAAAEFLGTVFEKRAQFNGSTFLGVANFGRAEAEKLSQVGARLRAASFDRATFEANARFGEAVFHEVTSFRECCFGVVELSPTGRVGDEEQFQNRVDLRGCTYDRIQVAWRALLARLPGASDPGDYDRQPYVQMEKVFRAGGRDEEADAVYLERRRVERQRKSGLPRAWDVFWWGLANYGVRPYRLLVFAALLLVAGTIVFHRPGAVEPKAPAPAGAQRSANEDVPKCPAVLSVGESARFSLRWFLPVELPLLEECQVAQGSFSDFAALLKVLGWIIVPVGLAALAGVLRRGSGAPGTE